jgi:uncharacterized YccA/Bax inhibitor family protein
MASPTTQSAPLTSGNPAFNERLVSTELTAQRDVAKTMSVGGTALKTFVLLGFVIAGGAWGWASATETVPAELGAGYGDTTVTIPGGFWLASFGALFVGIFVAMNPRRAAFGGIVYALLEGYVLGAISALFDAQTEGVVGAAIVATVSVFFVSLFLYATGIIKPTRRMAFGVAAAIGGLCLLYLFVGILAIFNWSWLYSEQFQTIGVIVSLIAVVLAALSFTLDFAQVAGGVSRGAPKYMEWYSAYGLMVTLIWLYITLLRLLAFLARRR